MFLTKHLALNSRAFRVRTGITVAELLITIAVIAILVAFLLPPVTRSREAVRGSQCKNNLKQIGMALHAYEAEYGTLPPTYTVDQNGKPLHSWRTLLLPYVDRQDLYRKIDLSKPWNDPANAALSRSQTTNVYFYTCPSVNLPQGHTTYLAVITPDSCMQREKPRRLSELSSKHDRKVMLVEVDVEHAVPWMAPEDADESLLKSTSKDATLPHHGGMRVTYVDGTVGTIDASASVEQQTALFSISGGDQ